MKSQIKSHHKLKLRIDVEPLREALNIHADLFGQYPQRGESKTSPHHEMKDIWIRFNDIKPYLDSGDFSDFSGEHDSSWYDSVKKLPEVLEPIFKIMTAVQGERLGGVLITRLLPGGEIKPHKDSGWHAAYYEKYYVAITNKKGSTFCFHDGVIEAQEGEVYWFSNSNYHWVKNETDSERIAMIVCIKTNNKLGV